MKTYKKVMRECKIVDEHLCDSCGKDIYNNEPYNGYESKIEIIFGESYPDGGSGEKYIIDICEKCSEEFIKFLKDSPFALTKKDMVW